MAVYFHGSFGLDRTVLARLITLAREHPDWKNKDLAAPFNYGAPFAAKHRSWLHKTGLAEMRLPLRLTPKGKIVVENDPALETQTTQWFLHHELTEHPTRAEAWHFFGNEFLPEHQTFTREDLLEGLTMKLRGHSEEHFGPGSKLNRVIALKLVECYTEERALGALGLLRTEGEQYIRGNPKPQGPWETEEDLHQAYVS